MSFLHLLIVFPIFAVAIIPIIAKAVPRLHLGWAILAVPIFLFISFITFVPQISANETIAAAISWIPALDLHFAVYLDGLSLIFALLITGVGSLVVFYSIYYLSKERESLPHFYSYLMLFMGAMLGVVLTDNLMVLYLFWELTSVSSFLLIAFWYRRRKSQYGAQKSFLITVGGGIAMLMGFIMLQVMSGTTSIQEIISMRNSIQDHELFIPALVLILLGAFTKSAQFPFHIWLPDAMEAPTPVSAYLHSATMVKAGLFLVARFTPVFGGEATWFWLVSGVGIFTMFWGALFAMKQKDLKALLAYSTISQLGLIMSLFGLGSAALNGGADTDSVVYTTAIFVGLFHLVNHSTFKGALFMIVGIIDHGVGTRDIRKLGGLITLMPITFTLAVISSFSMAGMPPFNGFLSKEMFFTATLTATELSIFNMDTLGVVFPGLALIGSIFTFTYSTILVFRTFTGNYQREKLEKEPHEASIGLLISPIILCSLVVLLFFFPNQLSRFLLAPAMNGILPSYAGAEDFIPHIYAWHGFNTELFMTLGVVAGGFLLFKKYNLWKEVYDLFPSRISLDNGYRQILSISESTSNRFTNFYMTGFLRHYLFYIYAFLITVVGGTLFITGSFVLNTANDAPIGIYEALLVIIMGSAAVSILFTKSRMTATLLNGVLGYCIAIFFVLFRAPDLALTQLVVETVTTVLFLLCFYHLPEWSKEDRNLKVRIPKIIISASTGALTVLIALSVQGNRLFESISSYFEESYELAGGRNIVNTILGDFRALDTMLEVVVLFIAGIGVYTLIKVKAQDGGDSDERK
ncbi:Na+/H+ antiporter subunit A [Jeotgalibacillus proteolyticus]|uniref:Na+/H+ antiporter subunit A n=1 Tax=Jeotgalibacillus proteolyticus TaxID=2082395 RepID=A0A2S5G9X0_9BACL|nr:Na+/H+ antiporter subunit A [Jeotgalibacillus proteolyticus]PPA69713.1 Na+/H+ antiporter subunit A [Jeotgalibacillus proteolyticus]